jgi:DNA topoisomerase-1
MGRFGPFVQIGTRDDEDKPRFAGLRPGQKMDTVTLEEALALFELPRVLGETEDGEEVSANIGRYGPYVRYGRKFVSLKDDDPYTVDLERALELIREKKIADANRVIRVFEDEGIQVLNGRYGPYITDGNKNAKVPKDRDPKSLTLEECQAALAAAPERRGRKKAAAKKAASKKTAAKKAASKKTTAKKSTSKKKSAKKKTVTKKKAAGRKPATAATRGDAVADSAGEAGGS